MYDFLLQTPLKNKWRKIGVKKRAGVIFPLFSLLSRENSGIGEITDLKIAIDWCRKTNNSILQILPINDTGFQSSPFSPQSSIGLNIFYLSLSHLKNVKNTKKEVDYLRKKYVNKELVDYEVGWEKTKILRLIFKKNKEKSEEFQDFIKKNDYWLNDFSVFRALKFFHKEKPWNEWKIQYKKNNKRSIEDFKKNNKEEIFFWKWIQWQLFEQLKEIKNYANKNKVLLKGDLPFFVSRDSVDCWKNSKYFKFNLESGAPPDYFSKSGQRWGTPPYDWNEISKDNFKCLFQKLKYAENFYDLFRMDHVIGFFRTWSLPLKTPDKSTDEKGFFDLKEEKQQIQRGEKILNFIVENTEMLPCAEDLGTIPDFCRNSIKKLGIPGLDIGRKQKNYRKLAVASLSTHDLDFYPIWLKKRIPSINNKIIEKGLNEINLSPPIFSILLIFEWLFLDKKIRKDLSKSFINKPGKISKKNWAIKMPVSLENMMGNPINQKIKKIIKNSKRF